MTTGLRSLPLRHGLGLLWAWFIALAFPVAALAAPVSEVASRPGSVFFAHPAVSRPAGSASSSSPASSPASIPASRPTSAPLRDADRQIRVRLLNDVSTVLVEAEGPVELINTDTREPLGQTMGDVGRVVFRAAGIQFPDLDLSFSAPMIDIVPQGRAALGLARAGRTERYPGALRLVNRSSGLGAVVNVLDIEDYLPAVLAMELDQRFHLETFRAQAIAARTFAWYQMRTTGRRRFYDVTAGQGSQAYASRERLKEVPLATRAVRDTVGVVCTWRSAVGDRIFCTYYSSACGGWTQSASAVSTAVPEGPLVGNVPCRFCQESNRFNWGPVTLAREDIATSLGEHYERFASLASLDRVEVREATPAARPVILAVVDIDGREERLHVEAFRLAMDPTGRRIRSSFFVIDNTPEGVALIGGRGYGHGVGLCQHGADAMARQGATAAGILRHYYPGSKLRRAY